MAAVGIRRPADVLCGAGFRGELLAASDIVELNVGGERVTTTRRVLTFVQGSRLAELFSVGGEAARLRRDLDGTFYLDVDPVLFAKVLSFLRFCMMATPDCPAPLPQVPEDLRSEYVRLIKELGLDAFMYGDVGVLPGEPAPQSGNILRIISTEANEDQGRLQSAELVELSLSSSAGAPRMFHEEALSEEGLFGVALENSYGSCPGWIRLGFLKHKVRIESMKLRIKMSDASRMSDSWDFIQGSHCAQMGYSFSWVNVDTGRLHVPGVAGCPFVKEVEWRFPRDFCIERIKLYGQVVPDL